MRSLRLALIFWSSLFSISAAAGTVSIEDLRIAFEQRGESVLVREMITLRPDAPGDDRVTPHDIPLPAGARHAQVMEQEGEQGMNIEGDTLSVDVPKEGLVVQIVCELPVLNGVVALDQQLDAEVVLAHAAFVGMDEGVTMKGNGFSLPEGRETPDGLPALFSVGQNFEEGHIQILLSGFESGPLGLDLVATVLSFGMLAAGLFSWLRRAIASGTSGG